MTGNAPDRLLTIPSETESSADFRARLAELLKSDGTHLYIDTSFLMWLTKIGSSSRQELFQWLDANCAGRVHVPIWSAHEYLKHHVAGTIITELTDKTNEVADLVGRTYTYFRPFIDEPYGDGADDPSTLRAATRAALNALDRLTATTRQWHKSYQRHASEVIDFINGKTPDTSTVYDELKEVAATAALRFVGSVPPGFQDRRKKGSAAANDSEEAPLDSNRYGDLVFWKELLAHAKSRDAVALVILTNDRKNDWHLGRSERVSIDADLLALKKAWKPVPRPHPMLVMEARMTANVTTLELLDTAYLAALLRDFAEDDVRAFADVAIIPDGPEAEDERTRRARAADERRSADEKKVRQAALEQGHLFADPLAIQVSKAKMLRALLESREAVDEQGSVLLESWRATVEAQQPLSQALTAEAIEGLTEKDIVRLGRELHDRVLNDTAGYEEALTDLVSLLERLPPNTATSFYLGLLASAFLERKTNHSRIPPQSPVAQFLFDKQESDFAGHAVTTVAKRLTDNEFRPLYIPDQSIPELTVAFDTEPDTERLDELASMKLGIVELLTPAQADEGLRLATLFPKDDVLSAEQLMRKASELFLLPEAQMKRGDLFECAFSLTPTIGFKRPSDIKIPKEAE
ncbi:hypothetical protein HFO72_05015 [Rhizobium laguerreae]|uniref:PIN-like domain-containing protein n=1 Tax=Rhizobium laguerreae TaxID=1076926 RepID=UPI001C9285D7|nr:PIN-like domain-containing protein [Rhizobium laguerreae]MBY3090189.1 hypothetical protein [Rhizobium laguerreae]